MAEEILSSIIGKIVESLVAPIGRQLGYVFCYNANIETMKKQVEQLEAKRSSVELLVDAANNNCEAIGPDVELWLNNVEKKKTETDLVLVDKETVGRGCLNEWCLHLKSRYRLSKKATKCTQDLTDLLARGESQRVAYPKLALGRVPQAQLIDDVVQVETTSNSDSFPIFEIGSTSASISGGFESRLSILRDVMDAVRDDKIHTIGICGMGGIGKTTMIEEVAERARKDFLFDEVAMAVVSKDPDEKKIQDDIADFLNLKITEDNLLARASRLHERLSQKGKGGKFKKILIILDDLWKELDLKKVGIPFGDDYSGCKLVLASRSNLVCLQMNAKTFSIPILDDDEAMTLFKISCHTSSLYPIAKDIVKECRGLPIAIKIIAKTLTEEEETWNYVLGQLKKCSLKGEHADVYKVFQVSYDHIKHEEVKDIFLLCCLYPEDSNIPIEELVRYGFGRRIFRNVDRLHEARAGAHAHVEDLKNLNLLLQSNEEECIKMHDLVRGFGLSIASKDKVMARFDRGLKEWPTNDASEHFTSISMQCDEIDELPDGFRYLKLNFLQLKRQGARDVHPFQFSERLDEVFPELQVMSLEYMYVPSLLRQVQRLTNLRTLSLHACKLSANVSMIGDMKQLEILTLVNDGSISELPREIRNLCWLRLLDLRGCNNLKKVAHGVLSCLVRLEELYMEVQPIHWMEENRVEDHENMGEAENEGSYASISDLKHLQNLFAIHIHIPYKFLPVELNLENVKKFKISVSNELRNPSVSNVFQSTYYKRIIFDYSTANLFDDTLFLNTLYLEGDEIVPLRRVLKALCKKTEILFVKVSDIINLGNEVAKEDFSKLKFLIFRSCDALLSVFDVHSFSPAMFHPFGNLRHLELISCSILKGVFTTSVAKGLSNLESLQIQMCSQIKEIIYKEKGGHQDKEEAVVFVKLRILCLAHLPNLIGFCNVVDNEVRFPQLKHTSLCGLPKLICLSPKMQTLTNLDDHIDSSINHPFFHHKVSWNSMENLEIREMEDLIELWPAQTDVSRICRPIMKIIIWSCKRLLRVFASNMIIQQLHSLESLRVSYCSSLEVVYDVQVKMKNEGRQVVSLSTQLTSLELWDLPELTHVLKRGPHIICQGFQNLKELEVHGCSRLKCIFPLSIVKCMVMLETVKVKSCDNMEAIFTAGEGEGETSTITSKIEFPKLKTLNLQKMPSLIGLCNSVDVVVNVALPQLQSLNLKSLPVLSTSRLFYSGIETTLVSEQPFVGQKDALATIFPANVVHQLQNLEQVEIHNNHLVEVIFDLEAFNNNEAHELEVFPKLQAIWLTKLTKLTRVWGNVPHQIRVFHNLHKIELKECNNMKYLITISSAKVLVGLKSLTVRDCENMEAIVAKEDGEEENSAITKQVLFAQLTDLDLKGLPNLSNIVPGAYSLNSVENLSIDNWNGILDDGDIVQQVKLRKLRKLDVYKMENTTTIFQQNVIPQLRSLQSIRVSICDKVEVIFNLEGLNYSESHHQAKALSHLEEITLESLPNLTSVWKNVPRVIWGFQNLRTLVVANCDNLKHLLVPSMAKTLVSLEHLSVHSCESLEAIVTEEEDGEEEFRTEETIVLFRKLELLYFYQLPSLLSVFPKPYSFNWSFLQDITIEEEQRHLLGKPKDISDN